MNRHNRWISVLIGTTVFALAAYSPCTGQTWDYAPWTPYYSDSSAEGGDGTTYGWTTNVRKRDSAHTTDILWADTGVRITTMVELLDREGSISRSASAHSYTCEGVTWEWTGAPGTAPAQLLSQYASVDGFSWVFGQVDNSDGYPNTSTYFHSYADGYAANYTVDYNEASASTEGEAYSVYVNAYPEDETVGLGGVDTPWRIYGPGYYGIEIEFELVTVAGYETVSGLSEIDASVGIVYGASSYGSVDAPSEHFGSAWGYSGTDYSGYSQVTRENL